MPNHLTPEELSKELGIDRQEVIRVCIQEGVPIYQGKIDKTLFQAQLQAIGAANQPVTIHVHSLRRPRRIRVPMNSTIRNASQISAAVSYGSRASGRKTMASSGG